VKNKKVDFHPPYGRSSNIFSISWFFSRIDGKTLFLKPSMHSQAPTPK
jgi:hypothetical protein